MFNIQQNIFQNFNSGMYTGMPCFNMPFGTPNVFMENFYQSPTSLPQMPFMNGTIFNNFAMPMFGMFDTFQPAFAFQMNGNSKTTKNSSKTSSSTVKHWTKMTDAEMKRIYGNYTKKINDKYTGSVDKLNTYLKGKGVLEGKGQAFIDAQNKYGINAKALIAICMNESAKGTSDLAKTKNNVGGVRISGSREFRKFDKVEDCIDYMASFLKSGYVNQGLTTLYQVNAKYCPVAETSSNSIWAKNVNYYMEQLA